MTEWAMELSLDGARGFLAETRGWPLRTQRAYALLMIRLRIQGSVPGDDITLARIGECSLRWWTERAWPVLRELFEVSEEGRLYHPGVVGLRDAPAPETAEDTARAAAISARNRANAAARWEARRAALHIVPRAGDATSDATSHATSHRVASGNDATSTGSASGSHATSHPAGMPVASNVASGVASVASGGSRASSLSKQEDSQGKSLQTLTESFGERGSARAGADATGDATSHATDATSHATSDATSHATGMRPRRGGRGRDAPLTAPLMPLPDDFEPSLATVREAAKRGLDLADVLPRFRDWHASRAMEMAGEEGWNARLRGWLRDERRPTPPARQGHLTMPIAGGAGPEDLPTEDTCQGDAWEGSTLDAWAAVRRGIAAEVGEADFRNWLRPMVLVAIDGGEVTIALPSGFVRDWVQSHHGVRLHALWRARNDAIRHINFVVSGADRRAADG